MNFGQAIKAGFKNYAVFEGRASRAEYWWWWLFSFLVMAVLWIFFLIVGGINLVNTIIVATQYGAVFDPTLVFVSGLAGAVLWLAHWGLFIPSLSILIRRLRDTGRKAWYLLLVLVPLFGSITILVMLLQPSKDPAAVGDGAPAPAAA